MENKRTILVATAGQAIMRSHDEGASWRRLSINQDLEFDATVRCLLADPRSPNTVLAGAEDGLYRSENCGVNWHRVRCALDGFAVWKLAVAPSDPQVLYAGTGSPARAACFRSMDGGHTWTKLPLEMPPKCKGVSRPRMLALAVDPDNARDVWVGVEEGGLFHSRDGGDSWDRLDRAGAPGRVKHSDLHSVVVLRGTPKVVLALTVNTLHRSEDGGVTWDETVARERWGVYYSRVLLPLPGNDRELLLGVSDGTPGTMSIMLKSTDGGREFRPVPLPTQPNSCFWALGANAADPTQLLAGTKFGHLFRSSDGGRTWRKEWREFSEITDVTWIAAAPDQEEVVSHV
ncbi:MAG: glycosyl hydrolase [Proteobacteria bacterium]|nr:glycosyl hydrolase [Pseudomonadota bacterium]